MSGRNHGKWKPKRGSRSANVGLPGVPPDKKKWDIPPDVDELIEASSLGTPSAKALRESVSEEEAQRIVDRVNQADAELRAAAVGDGEPQPSIELDHEEDCDCEQCAQPKPGHDWDCEIALHGWAICSCSERVVDREIAAAAARAEANRDGRWDTWGGDGVGP